MQRRLLPVLAVVEMSLLGACAATDPFEADATLCRNQAAASAPSATEDFRLPEAMDQTTSARTRSSPAKETSAYTLCMRSRGWQLDENGRALGKGLPAPEYSRLLAEDLTLCARERGEEASSAPSAKATASSAARVVCACLEEKAAPGLTSVELGLVIGEGGKLRRVTAAPESPVAACLQEDLPESSVVPPPSAPWKAKVRILHFQ